MSRVTSYYVLCSQVAMETMKDQYSEHERRHGNDLRTIEEMQRTHRQQVMQWDNDRNILVSCVVALLVLIGRMLITLLVQLRKC